MGDRNLHLLQQNCVRLKGFGFSYLKSIIRVQEKIYNDISVETEMLLLTR